MVYAQSVNLPKIATKMPLRIQIEGWVQWLERLLVNEKFVWLEVMKPGATQVMRSAELGTQARGELVDDQQYTRYCMAVVFAGRALPLGWVEIPTQGDVGF